MTDHRNHHVVRSSLATAAAAGRGTPTSTYRTESSSEVPVCSFYARGDCRRGSSCRFRHELDTSSSHTGSDRNPPSRKSRSKRDSGKVNCSFFAKGYCRKGDACPFRHETPTKLEIPQTDDASKSYKHRDKEAAEDSVPSPVSNTTELLPKKRWIHGDTGWYYGVPEKGVIGGFDLQKKQPLSSLAAAVLTEKERQQKKSSNEGRINMSSRPNQNPECIVGPQLTTTPRMARTSVTRSSADGGSSLPSIGVSSNNAPDSVKSPETDHDASYYTKHKQNNLNQGELGNKTIVPHAKSSLARAAAECKAKDGMLSKNPKQTTTKPSQDKRNKVVERKNRKKVHEVDANRSLPSHQGSLTRRCDFVASASRVASTAKGIPKLVGGRGRGHSRGKRTEGVGYRDEGSVMSDITTEKEDGHPKWTNAHSHGTGRSSRETTSDQGRRFAASKKNTRRPRPGATNRESRGSATTSRSGVVISKITESKNSSNGSDGVESARGAKAKSRHGLVTTVNRGEKNSKVRPQDRAAHNVPISVQKKNSKVVTSQMSGMNHHDRLKKENGDQEKSATEPHEWIPPTRPRWDDSDSDDD